ncbi:uncharacterized protein B0H18DRAFT_104889 [Fomitopsis serialis]|uniref:uncharacterized protein n=1 Tax=Fomitopsis serialis TaxID=139415 RepID=UPI002008A4E8|nr:uncharacterized protein B0H18DRAFT_104889 [Neoantrodia serialis]KAH9931339.1 hypothetical protein B0H18DRAFT_104889 [Neoantrodia serialis]
MYSSIAFSQCIRLHQSLTQYPVVIRQPSVPAVYDQVMNPSPEPRTTVGVQRRKLWVLSLYHLPEPPPLLRLLDCSLPHKSVFIQCSGRDSKHVVRVRAPRSLVGQLLGIHSREVSWDDDSIIPIDYPLDARAVRREDNIAPASVVSVHQSQDRRVCVGTEQRVQRGGNVGDLLHGSSTLPELARRVRVVKAVSYNERKVVVRIPRSDVAEVFFNFGGPKVRQGPRARALLERWFEDLSMAGRKLRDRGYHTKAMPRTTRVHPPHAVYDAGWVMEDASDCVERNRRRDLDPEVGKEIDDGVTICARQVVAPFNIGDRSPREELGNDIRRAGRIRVADGSSEDPRYWDMRPVQRQEVQCGDLSFQSNGVTRCRHVEWDSRDDGCLPRKTDEEDFVEVPSVVYTHFTTSDGRVKLKGVAHSIYELARVNVAEDLVFR